MRKTTPLIFVPSNVKYISRSVTHESSFLTLEEKIKKNPSLREKLRCEAKIAGTIVNGKKKKTAKRVEQYIPDRNESVQTREIRKPIVSDPNAPKEYIKNMTQTEILLDFASVHAVSRSREEMKVYKPKTLKYYMAKWELSQEELNSVTMKRLYASGMIADVTEEEYRMGMEEVRRREDREKAEIERRRSIAEYDRIANPNRDRSGIRRLGGITVDEVDMGGMSSSIEDLPAMAKTGDGAVIHFDIGQDVNSPRRIASAEDVEMSEIYQQMPEGRSRGRRSGGSDGSDYTGFFTMGNYEP